MNPIPTLRAQMETSRATLHELRQRLAKTRDLARRSQLMRLVILADKACRANTQAFDEANRRAIRQRSAAE